MAKSKTPGPLNGSEGTQAQTQSPGSLGFYDHGDPLMCTFLGNTPGTLGLWDLADPGLPSASAGGVILGSTLARLPNGQALSLGADKVAKPLSKPTAPVAGAITAAQLKKLFTDADDDYLQKVADELNTDPKAYGLDTVLRKAHFFAQVRQEAGAALQANVESLNYGPAALKSIFSYYRLNPDEAADDGYVKDPKTKKITRHADEETIADNVYGGRLGNGSAASGDGWTYRGRGFIQITGRITYRETTTQYAKTYGKDGTDFEKTPDLVVQFPYSVRTAVCYWLLKNLPSLADLGSTGEDVDRITEVVNANTDSYDARRDNFTIAYQAFK